METTHERLNEREELRAVVEEEELGQAESKISIKLYISFYKAATERYQLSTLTVFVYYSQYCKSC